MIQYRHKKTNYFVTRDVKAVAFRGTEGGDEKIILPKRVVEESNDWERVLPAVETYPADLVEPLFNCRMENYEKYVDKLIEYRDKIQNS